MLMDLVSRFESKKEELRNKFKDAHPSYEDIVKRLDDYKHNRVPNSLMVGLLNNISDEDLKKLALEIASFK